MRPDYMANGERMHAFADAVTSYRDGSVKSVTISAGAAPDGNTKFNQKLSEARAQSLRSFFISNFTTMQLSSDQFTLFALGEDWDGLLEALQDVDEPWRDQAADIIRNTPVWVMDASGKVVDGRKKRLKNLSGGRAWRYLEQHVFQDLRCASGLITIVVSEDTQVHATTPLPLPSTKDTVSVMVRDTVYVPVPFPVEAPSVTPDTVYIIRRDTLWREHVPFVDLSSQEKPKPVKKKRELPDGKPVLAFRTNVLAVPLANLGIEIPMGNSFSLGLDWYYPWIWRPRQGEEVDVNGWCFQFMAAGTDFRYWFPRSRRSGRSAEATRLLGHSIGLYGAVGHYDFEYNYTGHQGWFYNVGVDYKYACPIFRDAMRLEFELGFGYIYSPAQPYDCFVAGEYCYRRKGITHYVRWFGPTKAEVSLVVPIRSKDKKGGKR